MEKFKKYRQPGGKREREARCVGVAATAAWDFNEERSLLTPWVWDVTDPGADVVAGEDPASGFEMPTLLVRPHRVQSKVRRKRLLVSARIRH